MPHYMTREEFKTLHNKLARANFIGRLNDALPRMTEPDRETVYLCLLEMYLQGKQDGTAGPEPRLNRKYYGDEPHEGEQ